MQSYFNPDKFFNEDYFEIDQTADPEATLLESNTSDTIEIKPDDQSSTTSLVSLQAQGSANTSIQPATFYLGLDSGNNEIKSVDPIPSTPPVTLGAQAIATASTQSVQFVKLTGHDRVYEQLTYKKHYDLKIETQNLNNVAVPGKRMPQKKLPSIHFQILGKDGMVKSIRQCRALYSKICEQLVKALEAEENKGLRTYIINNLRNMKRKRGKDDTFFFHFPSSPDSHTKFTIFTTEFVKQFLRFWGAGDGKSFMRRADNIAELMGDIVAQLQLVWRNQMEVRPSLQTNISSSSTGLLQHFSIANTQRKRQRDTEKVEDNYRPERPKR